MSPGQYPAPARARPALSPALVIVLALRAWQWFARPIDFWNHVPGTSGALYGYMWVTDANYAALLLVPLLVYACAGCLEGLLDAHRLVRTRSRGWAAVDFLGIAAGKALTLSAVVLASGLVVALPQVPAEALTPQLVLAFLGILARQALFFLVCAALMLAAYAPTSLVPAAAVAALAYGAVGYLLQGTAPERHPARPLGMALRDATPQRAGRRRYARLHGKVRRRDRRARGGGGARAASARRARRG